MAITSLTFALFILVTVILYFIIPKKYRWVVLLVASYIYYWANSTKLIVFLLISTLSIYFSALLISSTNKKAKIKCKELTKDEKKIVKNKAKRKNKINLIITILFNVGILATLKYGGFFANNINKLFDLFKIPLDIPIVRWTLPLGISYYTLQAISYVVDVYRGKYDADKNLGKVALFLAFFPQILEGPIGKFDELANQLHEGHSFDYTRIKFGLQLILWGLFKKLVIADRAALYVNEVFGDFEKYKGIPIVIAIVLYTFQIYADFSGCIDVVRGIAQIFGINLAENFRRPFFSKNVQEFWRRWHITLGTWLKEYIFYPVSFSNLGVKLTTWSSKKFRGSFAKIIPLIFALFFVWFTNGIWHGSSWKYIFYGLYYYILTILEIILEPLVNKIVKVFKINTKAFSYRLWQMAKTTTLVCGGMLIFRAHRLKDAFRMLRGIFTTKNIEMLFNGKIFEIGFKSSDFKILVIGFIIMFIVSLLQEMGYNLREKISKQGIIFRWLLYFGIFFTIIIFGIYGRGYTASSFIYGQF